MREHFGVRINKRCGKDLGSDLDDLIFIVLATLIAAFENTFVIDVMMLKLMHESEKLWLAREAAFYSDRWFAVREIAGLYFIPFNIPVVDRYPLGFVDPPDDIQIDLAGFDVVLLPFFLSKQFHLLIVVEIISSHGFIFSFLLILVPDELFETGHTR